MTEEYLTIEFTAPTERHLSELYKKIAKDIPNAMKSKSGVRISGWKLGPMQDETT